MKKLLIGTLCAAAAVQFANAEEFGAAASTADVSGPAIAADQAAMEMPSLKTSDMSAWEELSDYIADRDLEVDRKDGANNRFVVKEKISFTIRSQDVGTRYLELREGMMSLLLLKAKVKLARLRSGRIEPKKLSVDDDESTTLTREVERLAGMEFVGTTVLDQFESCQKDGNMFKCEIAILMSWSKESEAVAKAVKLAFENPKQAPILLKPGKNTIDGWANKKRKEGALGEWLGPRRYVDKDGVVWFIGIAASPCEKNERRNDKKIEEARMLAEAEVAWALYGDVKMTNVLRKTMKTLDQKELDDISDDEKSEFGTKFARMMSDESALETAGMIYPFEGVVKDASGQKINVVVAGISVQSKREALKDLRESEDTAREVKAGDASERRAREAKVGMPKKADSVTSTPSRTGRSDAKSVEPEKKGRLGTGVRHYSNDD